MTTIRSRIAVAALFAIAVQSTSSQPIPQTLHVGAGIAVGTYHGEFNSLEASFAPNPALNGLLGLQYNFSDAIAIGGNFVAGWLRYGVDDFARTKYSSNFFGPTTGTTYPGTTTAITDHNSIPFTAVQLFGKLYFFQNKFTPYGLLGIGSVMFNPENDNGTPLPTNVTGEYSTSSFHIPVGGGIEYDFKEKWRFWAELIYHRTFTDYLDGYAHFLDFSSSGVGSGPGTESTQDDHFTLLRVGASYQIFKKPPPKPEPVASNPSPPGSGQDTPLGDESASPPERNPSPADRPSPGRSVDDSPPDGPQGAFEGESNAADSDGDRLSDVSEREKYSTDPLEQDSDSDGLTDGEEVMLYGTDPLAADTDGDLLSDLAEIRRHGTSPKRPDTDGDRLSDNEELSRTGTDPLRGDSDGDGVGDASDRCPNEPGPVANDGCPEDREGIDPRVDPSVGATDVPELAHGQRKEFRNIFFRPNSDDLDFSNPATGENLVALLEFLEQCDDVGVLIEGHTSSEGNPDWNRTLSKMRADRVRDWLIANGVDDAKILGTVGYGSRLPKVDDTSSGPSSSLQELRAQNRRITALVRKPCE